MPQRLQKPKQEARILCVTALCAVVMLCVLYGVLRIVPFGENTVITGDLNGLYIRYFANFRTALLSGETIAYSFAKSLGGSMLGVLAYYCNSPFNLIYLAANPVHYAALAGLVLALKIIAACVTMAFFLGRKSSDLGVRVVPLALCYGFCMYALVYAQNIMWHDTLLLLPLVCWGIDVLVQTKRPFAFALLLGLAIFTDFYIAFMVCLFSVLYFGYEMLLVQVEKGARLRFWTQRCASFGMGALCGGALSGVLLLPAIMELSQTKGLPTSFALTGKVNFKLSEFFHRLLPGSFVWEDVMDGLPNVYCGTVVLGLVLLYFFAKGISRKEKLLSGAFLLVLFFSLYSADFYLLWHGLKQPIWFPYRNSFLFVFLLVFLAAQAFGRAQFSYVSVLGTLGGGAALLAVCFWVRRPWFTMTRFCISAIFCGALCFLCFAVLRLSKRKRQALCLVGVFALCMGEAVLNGVWVLPTFEQYPDQGYRQSVEDGTATVQGVIAQDDSAFRMEKTFFNSLNDPMTLGYYGMSHFSSARDNTVDGLLGALGYKAFGSATYGYGSTAFADALLGIKYIFAKDAQNLPQHLVPLNLETPYDVYQNPYAFPMAFRVPQEALAVEPLDYLEQGYNTFEGQNALFAALSGAEKPLFVPAEMTITELETQAPLPKKEAYTAAAHVRWTAQQQGLAYAALASESERFVLFDTGKNADLYFTGLYYGVLNLGSYKKGDADAITLTPTDPTGMDFTGVYVYTMDEALLAQFAKTANEEAPQLTMRQGSMEGSFTAKQDGAWMFSIPYDENLLFTIDGKSVPVQRCLGALCAVQVQAGAHTVQVSYRAPFVGAGLALTVAGAVTLLCVWMYLRKKENV